MGEAMTSSTNAERLFTLMTHLQMEPDKWNAYRGMRGALHYRVIDDLLVAVIDYYPEDTDAEVIINEVGNAIGGYLSSTWAAVVRSQGVEVAARRNWIGQPAEDEYDGQCEARKNSIAANPRKWAAFRGLCGALPDEAVGALLSTYAHCFSRDGDPNDHAYGAGRTIRNFLDWAWAKPPAVGERALVVDPGDIPFNLLSASFIGALGYGAPNPNQPIRKPTERTKRSWWSRLTALVHAPSPPAK